MGWTDYRRCPKRCRGHRHPHHVTRDSRRRLRKHRQQDGQVGSEPMVTDQARPIRTSRPWSKAGSLQGELTAVIEPAAKGGIGVIWLEMAVGDRQGASSETLKRNPQAVSELLLRDRDADSRRDLPSDAVRIATRIGGSALIGSGDCACWLAASTGRSFAADLDHSSQLKEAIQALRKQGATGRQDWRQSCHNRRRDAGWMSDARLSLSWS